MNKQTFIVSFILMFIIFLVISGCKQNNMIECNKNSDCIITGCSSEICSNKPVMSPCIIKPGYACLKFADCMCINNRCQWRFNNKYNKCMNNLSDTSIKD